MKSIGTWGESFGKEKISERVRGNHGVSLCEVEDMVCGCSEKIKKITGSVSLWYQGKRSGAKTKGGDKWKVSREGDKEKRSKGGHWKCIGNTEESLV